MDAQPYAPAAAEQMDSIYRRQRFIYDLTRRYYLVGRDQMIAALDVPAGSSVLEVGCGTARNLIQVAKRYPATQLYGVDISEQMLRTARGSVQRHGLGTRMTLAAGDATSFDAFRLFGVETFDRVFISYTLSMIPTWRDAVSQALKCVSPSGALHIVDFGDFSSYPLPVRWLQLHWLQRFSVRPIAGLTAKLAAQAQLHGCKATTRPLYGGYAIMAQLTRK